LSESEQMKRRDELQHRRSEEAANAKVAARIAAGAAKSIREDEDALPLAPSELAMEFDDPQAIRTGEELDEAGGAAMANDDSAAEMDAEVVSGGGPGVSASEQADSFLLANANAGPDEDQYLKAIDRGIVMGWIAKLRKWVADTGDRRNPTHYLFHTIRSRCLRTYIESPLRRDWKAHLRSGSFPASVVNIVRTGLHGVRYAEEFDQNPDLLGLPNGKVREIETGVDRDALPDDRVSKSTNVTPDSTQKPERFLQFLAEISQHNEEWKEYILRCLGYFCTGHMTERYLGFWTGATSGGKSILCDLLVGILGDYAVTASVKALADGELPADKEMQLFHRVVGARVVFASESSASLKVDPGLAKKLASKERLVCRALFENEYEAVPKFKWVIAAQDLTFAKVDAAIQVRLQVAHFRQIFAQKKDMHRFQDALPADLQLLDKLEKERAGILALMLDYAKQWYVDGLRPPACIVADTDKYFADVDDFGSWLDKRCAREDAFTSGNMLLVDYQQTAEAMGIEPMKRDAFSKKLIAAGFKDDRARIDGHQVRGFHGLRLRERDEDEDESNAD
jgi:putative DNA primase/helicase